MKTYLLGLLLIVGVLMAPSAHAQTAFTYRLDFDPNFHPERAFFEVMDTLFSSINKDDESYLVTGKIVNSGQKCSFKVELISDGDPAPVDCSTYQANVRLVNPIFGKMYVVANRI